MGHEQEDIDASNYGEDKWYHGLLHRQRAPTLPMNDFHPVSRELEMATLLS